MTIMTNILTKENSSRHVIFPIKYAQLWEAYKNAQDTFWTAEEIDLTRDAEDWEKLNDNERYFIKNILAFFAGSDGIIMENLAAKFLNEIQIAEARAFYSYQIFNEQVHSNTYSLLIDTYIKDENEKNMLFNAIDNIPCITKKAQWALKWIDSKHSIAQRLIAFAIVEGVFFSGSFCAIYWLKQRGLMPGLTFSNELISRDEGMHTQFAVLLYKMLIQDDINEKIDNEIVNKMFEEAVSIENEFINDSIQCSLIGMNATLMNQYIKFVADRLLLQLGYDKLFHIQNPFDFMELISLRPKSNFFEVRVGEYKRNTMIEEININDDF
jgi:ribonucleotide reductase beta subunit family protein with ferritin-like domain